MIKVLIIDDEKNIRETLKILIDWEARGYTICGEAENGSEGLRKCRELQPDLVITDIRMPGINGLDMIRALKENKCDVRVFIITGYSQFDYAKQALDYRVDGFLLKPVDEDELEQKLIRLREEIENSRENRELLARSRGLSDERFLASYIRGETQSEEEIADWLSVNRVDWKSFQLLILNPDDVVSFSGVQKEKIRSLIEEGDLINTFGYIFELDENIACLFEGKMNSDSLRNLRQIISRIGKELNLELTVYISQATKKLSESRGGYKRLMEVMRKSFFYRKSDIIFASHYNVSRNKVPEDYEFSLPEITEQLFMALDLNEEKEIEAILDKIKQAFIEEKPDEDSVKSTYIALYHAMITRFTEKRPDMSYLLDDYEKMVLIIGRIRRIYDLDELLKERLLRISFELCVTRPRANVIERAVEYIERHYDTNIKLKLLAEMFHYNTAYFGQYFRKSTGERFNTYLDKVRIKKAKVFLREGNKVYKVAEKTGFSDVDNFHKKFRKYTGMSPSEYRKQCSTGQNPEEAAEK